jgi:hypothetical protein
MQYYNTGMTTNESDDDSFLFPVIRSGFIRSFIFQTFRLRIINPPDPGRFEKDPLLDVVNVEMKQVPMSVAIETVINNHRF